MLPITGLSIKLTNVSTDEYEILNDMGEGVYTSENIIAQNGTYKLEFEYAGKSVWATTIIPDKVYGFKCDTTELVHTERFSDDTIRYVNYRWDNSDDTYHMFYIKNMESWSTPIYGIEPSKSITSSPTLDTTHQVNSRGFYYYGRHYMVLYKVNQEYVDLYYSSSNNSQSMTNPPSNVNNGFGIFTAMTSDTLLLKLK